MKIIYKSSASRQQLEAREAFFCNGIEVQMLNKNDDLINLKHCNQRIHSIHYPYIDKACYIHNIIDKQEDSFERVLQCAQQYSAAIILHSENSIDEIEKMDDKKIKRFIELIKKYPNVKICIENTTLKDIVTENDNTMDIPQICEYLNNLSNKIIFHPLLDICHLLQVRNITLANTQYGLSDALLAFNSSYYNIHLNYIHGAGDGKNHGVTFESNESLLRQIIALLVMNNIHANLILEVAEEDYVECFNARELHTSVLKILNESNALDFLEQ